MPVARAASSKQQATAGFERIESPLVAGKTLRLLGQDHQDAECLFSREKFEYERYY
jgi:hypothetical protein